MNLKKMLVELDYYEQITWTH